MANRGFIPYSTDDGRVLPWEYLPAGSITPKIGLALVQSSGKFAVAGATVKPTYISMMESASAVAEGTLIPVVKVQPDVIWQVTNSADMSAIALGAKVTTSNGMQVTATTTSGVATVVGKGEDTAAAGGTVYVRFE